MREGGRVQEKDHGMAGRQVGVRGGWLTMAAAIASSQRHQSGDGRSSKTRMDGAEEVPRGMTMINGPNGRYVPFK